MKKKTKQEEKLLIKYIGLFVLAIVVIFAVWFIGEQYKMSQNKANNISPLDGTVNSVGLDELKALTELPYGLLVYVHDSMDIATYNIDSRLLRIVERNDLQSSLVMIDISTDERMQVFLEELDINQNIPILMYFQGGRLVDYISRENYRFNNREINTFLREYDLIEQ